MGTDVLVDVLVVGAGPAGLTAAAELRRLGVRRVLVADREPAPGGIPRHSQHVGYGLRDLHRVLTGPAYARLLADSAALAGAEVRTGCTVTGLRPADGGAPGTGLGVGERGASRTGLMPDADGGAPGTGLMPDADGGAPGTGPQPGGDGWSAVLTSAAGIQRVRAAAVLLATGCRERPRAARLVPGDRPSGVLTTGELQQRVYLGGERLAGRALVVGAEHVSFSAALTLAHAGARVVALVTDQPRHASYAAFQLGAALRWHVPVWTSTAVTRVTGAGGRLAAVDVTRTDGLGTGLVATEATRTDGLGTGLVAAEVTGTDGLDKGLVAAEVTGTDGRLTPGGVDAGPGGTGRRTRTVACEWLVFTGDWIPDHVLARTAGIALDAGTRGPAIDTAMATSAPGVFAAGNLVHAAETADVAALSGRHAAQQVAAYLACVPPAAASLVPVVASDPAVAPVPVVADPPLRWISPNVIATGAGAGAVVTGAVPPPLGRFTIRAAEYRPRARLEAWQGGRLLARSRPLRLIPGRPLHLRASWLARVDPAGAPVRVGVEQP